MKHDQIVEKLSEYRDGALGGGDREEVSRHLRECSECSSLLSDWEQLSKAFLRRSPAPTPFQTEAFVARVTARLPGEESALSWLTGRWLVPAVGLSFAVLAFSFRSYAGLEVSDPASALLAGADHGVLVAAARPESSTADAIGFGAEDR